VAALNSAYAACIDADRLEDWPAFFSEQCLYKVTTAENHKLGYAAGIIYADSKAMLTDRISALREANIYERQRYRHILGMPLLHASRDGLIAAETPFLVVRIMRDGQTDLFATGAYLDKLAAAADGSLHYVERVVVCDSQRFDTLVAIPL
jgi:3-phenylpropionate/cinnamic acid dioxygenase small subunit